MNKYRDAIIALLTEMKTATLGLIGVITAVAIAIFVIKYLMGDSSDKAESISNIKKSLIMGGGAFFLIWLADEVIRRFNI